jgi:hypothetical protein
VEAIELFGLLIALPFGLGWGSERILRFRKGSLPMVVAVLAAGLPSLWMFYEVQQADSITKAASIYVVPILFCVALIPAAFGCSLAMPDKESK